MRITNQMITGNSLRNMQKSMFEVDKYTQQMTTGKKISKASEDPVIAVRALKLRTTVGQLEQYKKKNILDAKSWLDITTTSLENISKRVEDISYYCVQGSTDSFNSDDRNAIIDELLELKAMIHSEGNATYAGRYIFSGYKTDRSLAFTETENTNIFQYDIRENFNPLELDTKSIVNKKVDGEELDDILAGTTTYVQPDSETVYRIKLGYQNISETSSTGAGVFSILPTDGSGNPIDISAYTQTVKTTADRDTYYEVLDDEINVIEETGEIVFGKNVYNTLKTASNIEVNYAKNKLIAGELRPEHYYDCRQYITQSDGTVKQVDYDNTTKDQNIFYEVNFNQSLKVNTEGSTFITHSIANDINDMVFALQELKDSEEMQKRLKGMIAEPQYSGNPDAVAQLEKMMEDLDVEIAIKKENMQKSFSNNIEKFKVYMGKVSSIMSDVGSRMTKLDMIEIRVTEQLSTFKELKSSNEDIEQDDAIIDFKEATLVYESSLAATSKVMQKTLLDYL